MKNFLFKKNFLVVFAAVALVLGSGYFLLNRNKKPTYNLVTVTRADLKQEVSVTGKVKPAEMIDLAFETGGRISRISVQVGSQVFPGSKIMELESSQLFAQLRQAEANLEVEKAQLEELKKGTRTEELEMARTAALNAEKSLQDARVNLESVQNKAAADLDNAYNSALVAAQKSATVAKGSLLILTDIQYAHFIENSDLIKAKQIAVLVLLGTEDAGRWTSSAINNLSGGAWGDVQKAVSTPNYPNIDEALLTTAGALQKVKDVLATVPVTSDLTSTEKTNLSTEKTNIATEITTISQKTQTILVQKATNESSLAAARASLTAAQNALDSARDSLKLKEAGATLEQLLAQTAAVRAVEAGVENIKVQIGKTVIFSPIAGVITKKEIEVGENVSPNIPVVSLISSAEFEIEAKIPEVDIAKVKLNDASRVTLDAYGSEVVFEAKVVRIDPAETMVEGLPTYKVILQFLSSGDERPRSGMTADIDILTVQKKDVMAIPQRSVITRNGDKIVRILVGDAVKEVKVKIGLRGSAGEIEITEGLSEGDKAIISLSEK